MNLREAFMASKLLGGTGGGAATIQPLSVSANGEYTVPEGVDGFTPVNVNVPASAVDSGTKSINTNGTHDVVGYANAQVSVPASAVVSGTVQLSENGTFDVTQYANAEVNVSGGGGNTFDEINNLTWDGKMVLTGAVVRDFFMRFQTPSFSVSGENVVTIAQQAFQSSPVSYAYFPNATSIGAYAFAGCSRLSSIDAPKTQMIGDNAFSKCFSLAKIYFPSATSIGASAFYQCSAVSDVSLPEAARIGTGAFFSCLSMSSINLPKLSSCASTAFMYCNHLQTFIAGQAATATTIYSGAFRGCVALESVYLLGANKTSIQNSFVFSSSPIENSSHLGHFGSVFVPASLLSEYKSYGAWSYFSDRIVGLTDEEIAALNA